jgi:hypothetical protein
MIGALVAFTLCAAAGPAVGPIEAAEASLADANFDEALQQLDRLVADRRAAPLHGRAQLLRAQCLNAKGDSPGTERALAAALESDPESRLDPHAVSPRLVSQLEALRQRARADVRIKADRPDAVVRLGDRELGTAPLKLQLPIGRHRLQAKTRDGRFAASQEVLLFPNRMHELSLSLGVADGIRAEPAQPERRPPEPSARAEPRAERAEETRETSRAASGPGSCFYGGGSLGEGHGVFLAEIGWPALQLSYLRGATDRVDLGGLFAFTYGFEGIAGVPTVPGVRLGGLLRVRLYDGPKLNFGLRLSPAMVLHFFPDNTVFGFAVPLELAAAMPMTPQLAFHFGLGVPLALLFAEGSLAILSFLPGAGIEYRPLSGLTVAFDMKLGPAFLLSGDRGAGFQFHMALGLGYHF